MQTTDKIQTLDFRENFIEELADFIQSRFPSTDRDLSRLAIVFGGKRPSLFLKRALAKRMGASFFPPVFFTIDEFIEYTVAKEERLLHISDLDLSYLIYSLAKDLTPTILQGRDSFSGFLPWAREIMSFIEQIDLEDIPSQDLRNIQLNAQIGYAIPDDINNLLENIILLRDACHHALAQKKMSFRGLQYLKAAAIGRGDRFPEFDQILFGNFFFLHKTESRLINTLLQDEKALLFFQGNQDEWPVLRDTADAFSTSIRPPVVEENPEYALQLHAGFDTHSQVCLVREILKKLIAKSPDVPKTLDQTVIVLPDPDHVVPLLAEISSVVKDFNVSMGYPLKRSSFYSLFEFIFHAQQSRRNQLYYAKDYLKVLRHPFVKSLKIVSDPSVTRVLIHKVEEILKGQEKSSLSGSLFFALEDILNLRDLYEISSDVLRQMEIPTSLDDLRKVMEELHRVLFGVWEGIGHFHDFAVTLEVFLDAFVQNSLLHAYPLNLKIAAKIFGLKEEFKAAAFSRESFSADEIFRIFQSRLEREIVAFIGSPLKGLQILGLFETRSLNFENVIVMDVNEGTLPKLQVFEPLIPREVMISLNLDRLEQEEEIQRYQLMRLIHSAKSVDLVYEESRDREKSRFVEELIWNEQKKQNSLKAIDVIRPSFEVKVLAKKTSIPKTPEIREFLKKFRYSASSINTYLHCPLKFYFNHVLGLNEKEDLLEDPENKEVGTFLHGFLEETFKPQIGRPLEIDEDFREKFKDRLNQKFSEVFERTMNSDSFLLKKVLEVRLKHFIEKESEAQGLRAVKEIITIEQRFTDLIPLAGIEINFVYKVDRIDRLKDETFLILDYKTGGNDPMPKSAEQLATMPMTRESIQQTVKSFQIPLYFYYFDKIYPQEKINAAFYNLRTLDVDPFFDERSVSDRKILIGIFIQALDFILKEILDEKKPFVPDDSDARFCGSCPYFYVCR